MKKLYLLFSFSLIILIQAFSQNNISGKSESKSFTPKPQFETQELPPNLYVDLKFIDENGNGILESEENAELQVILTNKGKGLAQGLQVDLTSESKNSDLKFDANKQILYLYPDKSATLVFKMVAGLVSESKQHKFAIKVKEHFGYDTDEAFLTLNTLKYQQPEIAFSGFEIIDIGEGTATINPDGLIQQGEKVFVKIFVQNIGQGNALNALVNINSMSFT